MANFFSLLLIVLYELQESVLFSLKECSHPLGMESGRIEDSQLSASSSHDADSTGPQNSRIRTERGSGAWCPRQQISAETVEWLQIDFEDDVVITAVETQGRFDAGRGLEYAPSYMLEYWRESLGTWARYKDGKNNEVIAGNSDTQSSVLRALDGGIVARNVRIIPVSELTRTVCMRVELYGCSYKDQLISYAVPEGDSLDGLTLQDFSYDGYTNSSRYLVKGLGKLYDGVTGEDNFEKHPDHWIGWRRELHGATITIEMFFTKKKVINAVLFHVSNFLKSGAQVFERAHVWFSSQGEGLYSPRTLHFNYISDKNFQSARWVRIPVPSRVAKELRVELSFSKGADWLLLSEIKFEFANEVLGPEDIDDEELDIDQMPGGDTLTYFAVNDTSEDGIRWISIAVAISLIFLFCTLIILLYLLWIYRRTFPRKAPFVVLQKKSKDVKMTIEGPTVKRTSPNAYRMTNDNMQNSLLEKLHIDRSSGSEYAEPDYIRNEMETESNSTAVCDSSKSSSKSTAHYASSDIYLRPPPTQGYTLIESSTSSMLDHSYDEVHAINSTTNFVEIDPQCFRFREHLGCNRYGEIWLCQLEQRVVVNKMFHRNHEEHIRREFESVVGELSSLRHQNILEVIGVCWGKVLISCIHECFKDDLGQYLRDLNIESSYRAELLLSVCTQVAAGMSYLESRNFVHGNLSASSCLVAGDGTIKLTNFSISSTLDRFEQDNSDAAADGRIRWMPWEMATEEKVTTKGDVWSFGVTLWEVLNGCREYPYKMISDNDVYRNLLFIQRHGTLKFRLERPEFSSTSFYEEFLVPCWARDPEQRPSFHSLHRRLQNVTCTQMSEGC